MAVLAVGLCLITELRPYYFRPYRHLFWLHPNAMVDFEHRIPSFLNFIQPSSLCEKDLEALFTSIPELPNASKAHYLNDDSDIDMCSS